MARYEIIAFYKKDKAEVVAHAAKISASYGWDLRYEKAPEMPESLITMFTEDTVACVFSRDSFGFFKLLKYIYQLKKPVFIVRERFSTESYDLLKVPVGYLQENKEKVVWANFFQRSNPSARIELVIPEEKDEDIAGMVENNVAFIENIFDNSDAKYTKTYLKGSFEKILKVTFKKEERSVIFLMRPFRIFAIYRPLNLRLFNRYAHTVVLIIPRDDELYVPCH